MKACLCENNLYYIYGKNKLEIFTVFSSNTQIMEYYRVIALISVNIVPSWDIEGRELASVRRYPNEGQYSPISVQ